MKKRDLIVCIILSLVTCGLYSLYWVYCLQEDSLYANNEKGTSGAMVIVLTIVTCGLYGIYWAYKLGERIDEINNNENGNNKLIYLVLSLFGLTIVTCFLAQDALNKIAEK